jgi:hypothetical protein
MYAYMYVCVCIQYRMPLQSLFSVSLFNSFQVRSTRNTCMYVCMYVCYVCMKRSTRQHRFTTITDADLISYKSLFASTASPQLLPSAILPPELHHPTYSQIHTLNTTYEIYTTTMINNKPYNTRTTSFQLILSLQLPGCVFLTPA